MSTIGDLYIEQADKLRNEQAARSRITADVGFAVGQCEAVIGRSDLSAGEKVEQLAEQVAAIRRAIGLDS